MVAAYVPPPTPPPPPAGEAAAWAARADPLAAWAWRHLVNRTDAWGGYLPERFRAASRSVTKPRRAWRGLVFLTGGVLRSHFLGRDVGHVAGLHAVGPDGTSRWVAVDVDAHGDAEDDPARNRRAALFWHDKLASLGFTPLLIDSDGRGGYHLWVVFAGPVPAAAAYRFARWVVSDYASLGYAKPPEAFPKQPGGTRYGNWLRLPGRHHSRPHWSKVWGGAGWLEGGDAVRRLLATTGDAPALIPTLPDPEPPVVPPPAGAPPGEGGGGVTGAAGVIDAFNRLHRIEDLLARYGYVPTPSGMYSRPGRDGVLASVSVRAGRSYHHSTNDRAHDPAAPRQRWLRPFALFLAYEHGGDLRRAVRAAALALGVAHAGPSYVRRSRPIPLVLSPSPFAVSPSLFDPDRPTAPAPAGGAPVITLAPNRRGTA